MSTPDPDQRLRDERALRAAVEERLAGEVEKARIWRQRAEERAAAIRRLRLRPWERFRRRGVEEPQATSLVVGSEGGVAAFPLFPAVRVGAITGSTATAPVAAVVAVFDPLQDRVALEGADLVLIDDVGWGALPPADRSRLVDWAETGPRAPLVLWDTGTSSFDGLDGSDAVRISFPPSFDPGVSRAPSAMRRVTRSDLAAPNADLVVAAAAGTPIRIDDHEIDDDRAGAAARRWVYRHHAPWVRLGEIAALAGVDIPGLVPSVAAVLVSNRPELVGAAVERIIGQTHPRVEIVVGLHGYDAPGVEARLDSAGRPWRVLRLPAEMSLGACLNAAIETTGADLVAKIDDDDHYGPAYIEDQVAALLATGAGMVGKATVYTFLEDVGDTVLRRPGNEHRFVPGTLGGASMVTRRGVWERVRFPNRARFVDTRFIEAARRVGERLYSSSRYEFCVVRHAAGHTYEASTHMITAGADPAWEGFRPDLVDVPDLIGTSG